MNEDSPRSNTFQRARNIGLAEPLSHKTREQRRGAEDLPLPVQAGIEVARHPRSATSESRGHTKIQQCRI